MFPTRVMTSVLVTTMLSVWPTDAMRTSLLRSAPQGTYWKLPSVIVERQHGGVVRVEAMEEPYQRV